MELLGYSERGFINALLYETAYRDPEASRELVKGLFGLVKWPLSSPPDALFDRCATIFVEQSFSDFGDADGLFLFSFGEGGGSVFLEGKRGQDYTLRRAWGRFIDSYRSRRRSRGLTSNLFCQVYFKQRLANALAAGSGEDVGEGLIFEAPFELASRRRKIGDNPVVLASADKLRAYLGEVYFLLMVPEPWTVDLERWWLREVAAASPAPASWDVSRWGMISIPEIVRFCQRTGLARTLEVVQHNEGQLYVEPSAAASGDLIGWLERRGRRGVTIIYAPRINPRTSLHFSWVGDGCALRDYSTASATTPPRPERMRTSEVVPLITQEDPRSLRDLDIAKISEWRAMIELQNATWRLEIEKGGEMPARP